MQHFKSSCLQAFLTLGKCWATVAAVQSSQSVLSCVQTEQNDTSRMWDRVVFNCVIGASETNPSVHPSIHPVEAAAPAGGPRLPFPCHISQLWLEDPEAFPGRCRDIISPPGPGSVQGPPPCWMCLKHLHREATRRHPYQTTEPPQLAPFNTKEQQLNSEFLMDNWTSHFIPKGGTSHPPKETHFSRLCSWSHSFGHDHSWGK